MTILSTESDAALAPVRAALRSAAEDHALKLSDAARRKAVELLDAARSQAAQIVKAAALEGETAARSEAALQSSRVRREAREMVLSKRSSVREELRRQLRESASALQAESLYPQLIKALSERCLLLLGPSTTVTESPEGGVIAESDSRRLDLSLPLLAEMCLDSMAEARDLWAR